MGGAIDEPEKDDEGSPAEPSGDQPPDAPNPGEDTHQPLKEREDPASVLEEAAGGRTPGNTGGHRVETTVKGNWNRITTWTVNKSFHTSPRQIELQLIDCLVDLPGLQVDDRNSAAFTERELQTKTDLLRGERLLLVSCSDNDLLFSAACAVIDYLGIPQERRKLLHFGRVSGIDSPDIHQLLRRQIDSRGEVVVVVDGWDNRAESFLGSLFRESSVAWRSIREELSRRTLYVICLTRPEATMRRPAHERNDLSFASWSVSYLRHLLRGSFPEDYLELERKIEEQRRGGSWSRDEGEFRRQLTNLIANDRLREFVGSGGVPVMNAPGELPEDPLHVAILYTTTFYPNLSPLEFSRVLTTVVGAQRVLVPETINQKSKDGTFKPVQLQRERLVIDIWQKHGDKALRDCGVITSDDGKRGVAFADVGRRDPLRNHFNQRYGLYVQSRFATAHDNGLLFDPAEQIRKNLILLTVEMMRTYPDHFGVDWMVALITAAHEQTNGWDRVADLLRAVMREPERNLVVGQTIRRLFDTARHAEILQLTQRLRFVADFDAFPIVRRLIDEGNEEVRGRAILHVERQIEQGGRAFPTLHILESWLPDSGTEPDHYPRSAIVALQIALVYTLGATDAFDPQDQGKWPTPFSLLAVTAESARDDLTLLLRLLLHPHMQHFVGHLLPEHVDRYIPALIAEWTFFLFGERAGRDAAGNDRRKVDADAFSAESAWNSLLERTIDLTAGNRQRQTRFLFEWETLRTALASAPSSDDPPREHAVRLEFAWKRDLVRKLIGEFRRLQRSLTRFEIVRNTLL